MSETKQQDLTRMLGVWLMRADVRSAAPERFAFVASVRDDGYAADAFPLEGALIDSAWGTGWTAEGGYFDAAELADEDLTEKLGDLDDLRRGADVLMQRREYVTAAVVYQLLGDEEGVERAVRLRREEIDLERQVDEDNPF